MVARLVLVWVLGGGFGAGSRLVHSGSCVGFGTGLSRPGLKLDRCSLAAVTHSFIPPLLLGMPPGAAWAYSYRPKLKIISKLDHVLFTLVWAACFSLAPCLPVLLCLLSLSAVVSVLVSLLVCFPVRRPSHGFLSPFLSPLPLLAVVLCPCVTACLHLSSSRLSFCLTVAFCVHLLGAGLA